jgi:hypothetical protein
MSNSVVERANSSILNALRTYPSAQENWPTLLPGVLAALRTGICTHGSQFSPFFLAFNREMNLPIDNILIPPANASAATSEYKEQLNKAIQLTADIATDNIKLQQEKYKQNYDKNAAYPKINTGDLVLLLDPKVPLGKSNKLHVKWKGPYYVVEKNDNFTYALHDCATDKRHPSLVHANRLRPYRPPTDRIYNAHEASTNRDSVEQQITQTPVPADELQQNSPAPTQQPTQTDNGDNATQSQDWFPVDKLLATRVHNKIRQYKVKWTSNDRPTWQNASDISPALIQQYHINRRKRHRRKRN